MVSPVYKGGYGVGGLGGAITAVASDGERVAFYSKGAFAGAPSGPSTIDYVAHREEHGWTTAATMPPASLLASIALQDVSPSLDSILALGKPGQSAESAFEQGIESQLWLHAIDAPDVSSGWKKLGPTLKAVDEEPVGVTYHGASVDWCHVFVATQQRPLLPEDRGRTVTTYEVDSGCHGDHPALRLLAVKNQLGPSGEPEAIAPSCISDVGTENGRKSHFNAISADGSQAFFTSGVAAEKSGLCAEGRQLFVRLGGERTVEVSKPLSEAVPCGEKIPCPNAATRPSATFAGASESGSRVYFTTTAPLAPATDSGSGEDLYMADIGCATGSGCGAAEREVVSIAQVSRPVVAGRQSGLQGVVRIAPDGSRVYFVATGVLSEAPNAQGQLAVDGADNLYAYDASSGVTSFVADLCSGPGTSGSVESVHCPLTLTVGEEGVNDTSLWLAPVAEAQTAGPDGRFLVFASYGQLSEDDGDNSRDLYRYDALTGQLTRVSIGENGADANGNGPFDAHLIAGNLGRSVLLQHEMNSRAIAEDGSTIVFSTSEPLSPGAVNGLDDVYEWHVEADGEPRVSLVSSGTAEEPVTDFVVSPTGRDIFFVTTQGLAPQDTDGAPDVYDARIGGGFAEVPTSRKPCSGDACQGPLTDPAPILTPGTASQEPGEDFSPVKSAVRPKTKAKTQKKSKAKRGRRARKSSSSRRGSRSTRR